MAENVMGVVYLLHFARPTPGGARHYIGWSSDPDKRLANHEKGRGGRLTRVAARLDIAMTIVKTWQGTRALEAKLKRQNNHPRHCPICRAAALRKHRQEEQRRRDMLSHIRKVKAHGY